MPSVTDLINLRDESADAGREADAADAHVAELARNLDPRDIRGRLVLQAARRGAALLRTTAQALEERLQLSLDQVIEGLRTDVPIALFPVRLETRFRAPSVAGQPGELLIRVYPDDVHQDTHEVELTDEEIRWGKHFWRETWKAGKAGRADAAYPARRALELAAWQQLATRFGPARAAYVAARLRPLNENLRPQAASTDSTLALEPDFDAAIPLRGSSWTRAARASALPDRWLAIASRSGQPDRKTWGALIPATLASGPDPTAAPSAGAPPFDPGMRWMVEFAEAERLGMGIRMTLDANEAANGFDRLIVLGVKGTLNDPAEGATALQALLEAHRFTWGCSFIPQGTPTNNTEKVDAGYSREDVGFQRSYSLEREEQAPPAADTDGAQAALALGLNVASVTPLRNAAGRDQRNAADFNRVLWPATLGYFLNQIGNDVLPNVDIDLWRAYFIENVRARGPLPAIRVGRQPYGLLPVSSLDQWQSDRMDLVGILRELRTVWRQSLANLPHAGRSADIGRDLIETLGLEAVSSTYSWRWARGPRFFDLFWRLPGQQIADATIQNAAQSLGDRVRLALQGLGLTDAPTTRLSGTTFAGVAFDWNGPLVEASELSETTEVQENYIRRFADPRIPLLDVHDESVNVLRTGGQKPLLYRLLRHATLLAYAEQALLAWPVARNLPTDPPWFEPEFVDLEPNRVGDQPVDPFRTPTFWRVLQTVLGGAQVSLGDDLRKRGANVPDPLLSFLKSLALLSRVPSAALARLLSETLDVCSHRLDAWITSLATSRLRELRVAEPTGVYVGGYGWVENLRPRSNPSLSDGFVHAPSSAHAATAAVLRSAYLAHREQPEGARLAIDLSSARVRIARKLLDGVRQGQPLAALLGYEFERALHDGDVLLNRFIAPLRQVAPLAGNLVPADPAEPVDAVAADQVVDGLKLLDLYKQGRIPYVTLNPTKSEDAALAAAFASLQEAVDAIGDLALAEGVHQAVQGNYLRAGASLDAISRGETPPDTLGVITTPQTGVAFTQRVILLLNARAPAATSWNRDRARAAAEPRLNAWAEQMLGSPERVRFRAAYFNPGNDPSQDEPDAVATLSLAVLDLCALDIVYAPPITATPQQSDLERRLARAALLNRPGPIEEDAEVRLRFALPYSVLQPDELTVPQLFEAVRPVTDLIASSRPLDARDLAGTVPGATPPTAQLAAAITHWVQAKQTLRNLFDVDAEQLALLAEDPFNFPADVLAANTNLLDLARVPLPSGGADLPALSAALAVLPLSRMEALRNALDAFNAFAVQGAVPVSLSGATTASRTELILQAGRVYAQIVSAEAKLSAIAGASMSAVLAKLAVLLGEGFSVLPTFTLDQSPDLQPAFQRRERARDAEMPDVMRWLQTVGRVRDGARRMMSAVTSSQLLGTADDELFHVAQFPFDETDRWNLPGASARTGATSLVVLGDETLELDDACAGLMVDEWVEVIPHRTQRTALAFHYDAPGARAPQAILLAVSPDTTKPWDTDMLHAILTETMELTQLRAVDYDALSSLGHLLPAVFLASNTGGDPHGDTVSSHLAR